MESVKNNTKYLIALSKFIDTKLNTNNNTYRAKDNKVLIEEISKTLTYNAVISRTPNIFKCYKVYAEHFSIRQKENKLFKLLTAHNLLILLLSKKRFLDKLLKLIKKSKTAKRIKFYKNNIFYYSQFYTITQFNKNANKVLNIKNQDKSYAVSRFINHLSKTKSEIDLIIAYLTTMFD